MAQVSQLQFYERMKLQSRVDEALSLRREALMYLRLGNRNQHRFLMSMARFPLRLARQWAPK